MSRDAQSVLVFAVYLFVIGAILVAAPNLLLSLILIPATHEVWIRVVGMLVLILGYYYLTAARGEMTGFFRATVHARFAVLVFFVAFVVLRLAPPWPPFLAVLTTHLLLGRWLFQGVARPIEASPGLHRGGQVPKPNEGSDIEWPCGWRQTGSRRFS